MHIFAKSEYRINYARLSNLNISLYTFFVRNRKTFLNFNESIN